MENRGIAHRGGAFLFLSPATAAFSGQFSVVFRNNCGLSHCQM